MSSHYPPLTCEQVKTILKNLGFKRRAKEGGGTSHEQWFALRSNFSLPGLRKINLERK